MAGVAVPMTIKSAMFHFRGRLATGVVSGVPAQAPESYMARWVPGLELQRRWVLLSRAEVDDSEEDSNNRNGHRHSEASFEPPRREHVE